MLAREPDYSFLDNPDVLQFVFYPRKEWTQAPAGARDFTVPVDPFVSISCRFYPADRSAPAILYFHGNGEVACDYDTVAPEYNQLNISLFVADYRGYGLSGGSPTLSGMIKDAAPIFDFFLKTVSPERAGSSVYLMGRSLGLPSVVELACLYPGKIKGLIVESGVANMARLMRHFAFQTDKKKLKELEEAIDAKTRSIKLPTLVIHGQYDSLIPLKEGVRFYETLELKEKHLVIIPEAEHNDIMLADKEKYFLAIKKFVFPAGA